MASKSLSRGQFMARPDWALGFYPTYQGTGSRYAAMSTSTTPKPSAAVGYEGKTIRPTAQG
jgi:hypothetical protein